MNEARIAELLSPFMGVCDAPHLFRHISIYIDVLLRWNSRMNLTAIRDPDEIVTRHFGESLFAARHIFLRQVETAALGRPAWPGSAAAAPPMTLADVGSGAGFPGVPIKLCVPELSVTLIESNHKRAAFLREIIRALILTGINVSTTRAEAVPRSSFEVVTLRAVERFQAVLPAAAALVRPHGRIVLLIGTSQFDLVHSILAQYTFLPALPIPHSTSRILLIGQAPTANQPGNQVEY